MCMTSVNIYLFLSTVSLVYQEMLFTRMSIWTLQIIKSAVTGDDHHATTGCNVLCSNSEI